MIPRTVFLRAAFLLAALLPFATSQAAELRLGAQGAFMAIPLTDGGSAAEVGIHLSLQGTLSGTLQIRGVLEGGALYGGGGGGAVPLVRIDADLLNRRSEFYYGGGFGSGVVLVFDDTAGGVPSFVYSPLLLLNVHAFVGRDFGAFSLEALARLGLLSGLTLRASVPLP